MNSSWRYRRFYFLIMIVKYFIKGLIFVCFIWVAYWFTIPGYEGYITDKVGVFSETEKASLTSKIEEIEKATSIEIAVLVVPTVDDDINLAAVDVGNAWWVGKKDQNNGLLLLIAVDDRKRSIQVGYGLEWTLPDLVTKRIGEARFPPNFRDGNYYQGVLEMLDDALWYIKQDPTLVQTYSQDTSAINTSDKDYVGMLIILFFAVSVFGRRMTIPSPTGKGRKIKKYGRWMYIGAWLVLSLIITSIIASFVLAMFLSYLFLLMWIGMAVFGKTWWPIIRFGWGWHGFGWWWGSSFWWFGWGSFGGWWSSWSR